MLVAFEIVSSELSLPCLQFASVFDFDLWLAEEMAEGCSPSRYELREVESVEFESI